MHLYSLLRYFLSFYINNVNIISIRINISLMLCRHNKRTSINTAIANTSEKILSSNVNTTSINGSELLTFINDMFKPDISWSVCAHVLVSMGFAPYCIMLPHYGQYPWMTLTMGRIRKFPSFHFLMCVCVCVRFVFMDTQGSVHFWYCCDRSLYKTCTFCKGYLSVQMLYVHRVQRKT